MLSSCIQVFFSLNSVKSVLHIDTEGATYSDLIVMHHCIITSVIHSVLLQQPCCCHCWGWGGRSCISRENECGETHFLESCGKRDGFLWNTIYFFWQAVLLILTSLLSGIQVTNLVFRRVCLNFIIIPVTVLVPTLVKLLIFSWARSFSMSPISQHLTWFINLSLLPNISTQFLTSHCFHAKR